MIYIIEYMECFFSLVGQASTYEAVQGNVRMRLGERTVTGNSKLSERIDTAKITSQ